MQGPELGQRLNPGAGSLFIDTHIARDSRDVEALPKGHSIHEESSTWLRKLVDARRVPPAAFCAILDVADGRLGMNLPRLSGRVDCVASI